MQSAETFPAAGPWCVQLTLRSLRYLNHECAESILKSGLGICSCSQLSTWAHGWLRDEADSGDGAHADLELVCRQEARGLHFHQNTLLIQTDS